jgi:hypothetical protein
MILGVFDQKSKSRLCPRANVGANLVFALRTKTENEPMTETNTLDFGHRFGFGFCSRANTRFAPTFALGHRRKEGTSMILCFYGQEVKTFKEKHNIIDVPFYFMFAR